MQLFYASDFSPENSFLDEEESKHCIRIMRLKKGDEINITDGMGNIFTASILSDNPKKCLFRIIDKKIQPKRNYHLHIAIAPPKNIARFEWFLEKASEIGIDEITPLLCERSERVKLNMERMKKILVGAMKQSLQAYLPRLNELKKFEVVAEAQYAISLQRYIAHCEAKNHLKSFYQRGKDVLILIGPEGDFSNKEIELAEKNNFQPVSLGETRLRTETAGIVACNAIHLFNAL